MVAGKQDPSITAVAMDDRLVCRAGLKIVGPDQLHVFARTPVIVVTRGDGARQCEEKAERDDNRRNAEGCPLHRSLLLRWRASRRQARRMWWDTVQGGRADGRLRRFLPFRRPIPRNRNFVDPVVTRPASGTYSESFG